MWVNPCRPLQAYLTVSGNSATSPVLQLCTLGANFRLEASKLLPIGAKDGCPSFGPLARERSATNLQARCRVGVARPQWRQTMRGAAGGGGWRSGPLGLSTCQCLASLPLPFVRPGVAAPSARLAVKDTGRHKLPTDGSSFQFWA